MPDSICQVPNHTEELKLEAAGSWAKKYFLASKAVMDDVLRPFDLGGTQWYVLHLLINHGAMKQRDLTRTLEVERATLSAVISVLLRKQLIEQAPDPQDQRQKVLHLTARGADLFALVPDPIALITAVAFQGVDDADVATTQRVLRDATHKLFNYKKEATTS